LVGIEKGADGEDAEGGVVSTKKRQAERRRPEADHRSYEKAMGGISGEEGCKGGWEENRCCLNAEAWRGLRSGISAAMADR